MELVSSLSTELWLSVCEAKGCMRSMNAQSKNKASPRRESQSQTKTSGSHSSRSACSSTRPPVPRARRSRVGLGRNSRMLRTGTAKSISARAWAKSSRPRSDALARCSPSAAAYASSTSGGRLWPPHSLGAGTRHMQKPASARGSHTCSAPSARNGKKTCCLSPSQGRAAVAGGDEPAGGLGQLPAIASCLPASKTNCRLT
mmetsp:Transcript_89155/g.224269  ORF Transcript_89155/g.224269 Transcript_89155/m.224269 type:complete len:201 (-) Transcript_89155:1181-1783(-)